MHTAGLRVRYVIRVELLAHHIEHHYYDFHKVRVCDGLCFFNEPIATVPTMHSGIKSHQLRNSITDNDKRNTESKKHDDSCRDVNVVNKDSKAMNVTNCSHHKHGNANHNNTDRNNNDDDNDMESDI